MFCKFCGANIDDNSMFCSKCGAKLDGNDNANVNNATNTEVLENYMDLAKDSYEAGNYAEVENYCNKIIEKNPKHYQAFILKGRAVGWQSSVKNNRFKESLLLFERAINNLPEDEKTANIKIIKDETTALAKAIVRLVSGSFEKLPIEDVCNNVKNITNTVVNALISFAEKFDFIDCNEIIFDIFEIIMTATDNAYHNIVLAEYRKKLSGSSVDPSCLKPSEYDFDNLINRSDYCANLANYAIEIKQEQDENVISAYEFLIEVEDNLIVACSYKWTGYYWEKEYTLTDAAKNNRKNKILDYKSKINEIELQEKQRRINAYWEKHKEEKENLDKELSDLQVERENLTSKIKEYLDTIEKLPETPKVKQLTEEIAKLRAEKEKLGIFKGKEKKALQEQIDKHLIERGHYNKTVETEKTKVEEIVAPLRTDLNNKIKRIEQINTELKKDRW